MPKSATQFVALSIAQSLDSSVKWVSTALPFHAQVDPSLLWSLMHSGKEVGRTHCPGSQLNIELLKHCGVKKAVLMVRDPRDAIVSWWHHIERPHIRDNGWSFAMDIAAGLRLPDYYQLEGTEQLDQLIELTYPAFIRWAIEWFEVINSGALSPLVVAYEEFVREPEDSIRRILQYFECEAEPVLVDPRGDPIATNYRRGATGSHRDELTPEQIQRVGTPDIIREYWEPEVWAKKEVRTIGGKQSEVWSVGQKISRLAEMNHSLLADVESNTRYPRP